MKMAALPGWLSLVSILRIVEQAEEKLSISEHRNKTLVDAIPDLLFRVNRDGTFLDYKANAADQIVYFSGSFSLGKKLFDVLPLEMAGPGMAAIDRAFIQRKLQTYEYRILSGGETRIFEGRGGGQPG